jgi:hypothetical protein
LLIILQDFTPFAIMKTYKNTSQEDGEFTEPHDDDLRDASTQMRKDTI